MVREVARGAVKDFRTQSCDATRDPARSLEVYFRALSIADRCQAQNVFTAERSSSSSRVYDHAERLGWVEVAQAHGATKSPTKETVAQPELYLECGFAGCFHDLTTAKAVA